MPAFGRWSMVYLINRYKNARVGSSLAKVFTNSKSKKKSFYVSSIYLFLSFLILYVFFGYYFGKWGVNFSFFGSLGYIYFILLILAKVLFITAALFLALFAVSWFFTRRISGITGDIIGGTSEIAELLFLFISYLAFAFI